MTCNTMTATQDIAPAEAAKHASAAIVCAGILVFILALLLIFPGFLAGLWSKAGARIYLVEDGRRGSWDYENQTQAPLQKIILYPSEQLMTRSVIINRFYHWQFTRAGGETLYQL